MTPGQQTTLERRVGALEARVSDIETGYGESLYRLEREAVANRLDRLKILAHLGVTPTTAEEIDAEMDQR